MKEYRVGGAWMEEVSREQGPKDFRSSRGRHTDLVAGGVGRKSNPIHRGGGGAGKCGG